jgi:hypothetical protein
MDAAPDDRNIEGCVESPGQLACKEKTGGHDADADEPSINTQVHDLLQRCWSDAPRAIIHSNHHLMDVWQENHAYTESSTLKAGG